jgi:hypothetical protein
MAKERKQYTSGCGRSHGDRRRWTKASSFSSDCLGGTFGQCYSNAFTKLSAMNPSWNPTKKRIKTGKPFMASFERE